MRFVLQVLSLLHRLDCQRGVGEAGAVPVKREVDLLHAYLAAVVHLLKNRGMSKFQLAFACQHVMVDILPYILQLVVISYCKSKICGLCYCRK